MADAEKERRDSGATTLSDASSATAGTAPSTAQPSPEDAAAADTLKDEGNKAFAEGKYLQAIDAYSRAIGRAPSAALFSNRAFAQLKAENYGSAIADAGEALKLDGGFVKAFYRRGSAHLALGKHKDARVDFRAVVKLKPADKDARAKLDECEKAIRRKAFEEAIAMESSKPASERLAPSADAMAVDPSYAGPVLPPAPPAGTAPVPASALMADENLTNEHGISLAFVKQLAAWQKAQKHLHKKYALQLLLRLNSLLRSYRSLVTVPFPPAPEPADGGDGSGASETSSGELRFNVCGDTHGQYYDTLNIFDFNGLPSPTNCYLFNGDFVDRGSFSVENVLLLFAWKLLLPRHFHLTRGNHETKNMNKMYGFEGEVKAKYDEAAMDLFAEVFQALPLGAVIGGKVIVVHGGLFGKDGVTLEDIARTDRFREPPEEGIMSDALWSDPQPFTGRGPSKRGVGMSFGPDVTERFLRANGLQLLIRSHEVMEEGYQVMHGGKCVTVFSAPNYCDQMGNKGGIVHLDADCVPSFKSFGHVPHPPSKPMQYAAGMGSLFGL